MPTPKQLLEFNLTNQSPTEDQVARIEKVRVDAKKLGRRILDSCPESRERALAITNLEQTTMWAVAAIAREEGPIT